MQVQWTFEGCNSKLKDNCRSYWEKKQERLERLLSSIPHGSKSLRLTIYCSTERVECFEARGLLNLPGRSLAVQFSDIGIFAVLDGLADKLVLAAKKFKERSSHFIQQNRKQLIAEDMFEAEALLVWDEKEDRKKSFFSTLRPLLGFIERNARCELKIYELEGIISPGQFDPADLVDEVVLLAWDKFAERPQNLSLEYWLPRLLKEVLDGIEWESQFVSLDQSFPLAEIDYTASPDWFEEVLGYQEEYTLAELVPDSNESETWEQLDDVQRNMHIYTVLQKLPFYQRQAYLLHSVNEYSLTEVSEIQERTMEEVEVDIRKSRKAMQKYMYEAGMVQ